MRVVGRGRESASRGRRSACMRSYRASPDRGSVKALERAFRDRVSACNGHEIAVRGYESACRRRDLLIGAVI